MDWMFDGRGRTAPAKSPDAMSEQEFMDRIIDTVVRTRLNGDAGYTYPDVDEELSRRYHAMHLARFSFFAWAFPSWLMSIASRCPHQDVRKEILEDCVDEEVGDMDAGGRCHIDVLYDEVEACGFSRDEVVKLQPSPIIKACIHAWNDLATNYPWEVSYAAISGLEMGSTTQAVELRNKLMLETMTEEEIAAARAVRESNSLSKRTGIDPEMLVFAALHAYKDQFHGGGGLAMLVKYGTTREKQEQMLWGVRTSTELLMALRAELDRLTRAEVGLPPRELKVRSGSTL